MLPSSPTSDSPPATTGHPEDHAAESSNQQSEIDNHQSSIQLSGQESANPSAQSSSSPNNQSPITNNPAAAGSSYGQILRSSSIIGGATGINYVIGMLIPRLDISCRPAIFPS